MNKWMILAFAVIGTASADVPKNANALATQAGALRDACTSLAAKHSSSESTEQFRRRLDGQEAEQRMRNEVSLYAIGHGRNQANQYALDLMRQNLEADKAGSDAAMQVSRERSDEVASCVTNALASGKDVYAAFKKSKRPKAEADEANALMTSWVVNVESISLRDPEGTEETKNAWQRAKSQVELNAL